MNFIISIDTECDKSKDWSVSKPLSYKGVYEGVYEILQPIFDKHGVKPVYFLSPEVIQDFKSVQLFDELNSKSELATHLHCDFIEPNKIIKPEAKHCDSIQAQFSYNIEYKKLENLTNLFIEKFNQVPFSFRAGRYGISKSTGLILQKLGYKVDSSVTPGLVWIYNIEGNIYEIDFRKIGLEPYFVSNTGNLMKEGESSLLQVPITIINDKINIRNLIRFLKNRTYPKLWMRPMLSSFEQMKYIIDKELTDLQVMMFHNMEVIPGCSPYVNSLKQQKEYIYNLEKIIEYMLMKGYKSSTFKDVYEKKKNLI